MMLTCKEVYQYQSGAIELTGLKRLQFPMHLFICNRCRTVKQHFETLNKELKERYSKDIEISEEAKLQLREKIETAIKEKS